MITLVMEKMQAIKFNAFHDFKKANSIQGIESNLANLTYDIYNYPTLAWPKLRIILQLDPLP